MSGCVLRPPTELLRFVHRKVLQLQILGMTEGPVEHLSLIKPEFEVFARADCFDTDLLRVQVGAVSLSMPSIAVPRL